MPQISQTDTRTTSIVLSRKDVLPSEHSPLSNRTNFYDKEAASIYYGIMAVAHKMELSLGTKGGITSAVNGCADQLTIWDGTKKLGFGSQTKKKGLTY